MENNTHTHTKEGEKERETLDPQADKKEKMKTTCKMMKAYGKNRTFKEQNDMQRLSSLPEKMNSFIAPATMLG